MKILISWTAFNNDYHSKEEVEQGAEKVNYDGPTMQFHEYFYTTGGYNKHIILSTSKNDDPRIDFMLAAIKREFSTHIVEPRYMDISDPIDITQIRPKIEKLLLEYNNDTIDIFFSPGTSIMQLAWYICHQSLGLKTRLLQTRSPRVAKSKKPELSELLIEQSSIPFTAIVREQQQSKQHSSIDYNITDSIASVYKKAVKIAQAETITCLIFGDSGTGKEHLANYIHKESARKANPFVAVNCSALNDNLLESRLFGYKKGAFTDAKEDKKGLLEETSGGTVFLDEIGDISPYMQQSLLRVLQQKEILPVGAAQPIKIDVRIVSATNKNLPQMCADGKFRWDLYYRLSVVELSLPTLQQRGEAEKKEMIDFFLKQKKQQLRKAKVLKLMPEVKQYLLTYPFPGNIRELENVIESFYVFCDDEVTLADLPTRLTQSLATDLNPFDWKRAEKDLIERALKFYQGNQAQVQRALGYGSINTLKSKMTEYELK
ncbi:sigma-54 dependent transcriptional regulator [Xanthocytophaga flava]|uniref:sigma-54 dependent transcriptional regulator n=1 Tax=Xanthocytophaga flava TaxID=3048013 RepID=UPI0028D8A1BD|nr:sigma-54 dependent transcriptional regulator [Xanthocytophaga flavus]MDJ1466195.1 sigma-54 dependent transcriptional regulator [Xanthocytophaga flavus]